MSISHSERATAYLSEGLKSSQIGDWRRANHYFTGCAEASEKAGDRTRMLDAMERAATASQAQHDYVQAGFELEAVQAGLPSQDEPQYWRVLGLVAQLKAKTRAFEPARIDLQILKDRLTKGPISTPTFDAGVARLVHMTEFLLCLAQGPAKVHDHDSQPANDSEASKSGYQRALAIVRHVITGLQHELSDLEPQAEEPGPAADTACARVSILRGRLSAYLHNSAVTSLMMADEAPDWCEILDLVEPQSREGILHLQKNGVAAARNPLYIEHRTCLEIYVPMMRAKRLGRTSPEAARLLGKSANALDELVHELPPVYESFNGHMECGFAQRALGLWYGDRSTQEAGEQQVATALSYVFVPRLFAQSDISARWRWDAAIPPFSETDTELDRLLDKLGVDGMSVPAETAPQARVEGIGRRALSILTGLLVGAALLGTPSRAEAGTWRAHGVVTAADGTPVEACVVMLQLPNGEVRPTWTGPRGEYQFDISAPIDGPARLQARYGSCGSSLTVVLDDGRDLRKPLDLPCLPTAPPVQT